MKRRARVLLDCDGVFADFGKSYIEAVQIATGRSYDHENINMYELHEFCELTPNEKREVNSLVTSQGFCASLAVLPGAKDGVQALREVADVFCVTTPWHSSPYWHYERHTWLRKRMGFADDEIIFTAQKYFIHGDVFVDDKEKHVAAWGEYWRFKGTTPVLWATPYNVVGSIFWTGFRRSSDWDEILRIAQTHCTLPPSGP